jgi:cytochrome c-type biogenesis protein CcmE
VKPGYLVGGLVIALCVIVTALALSGTVRRTVTVQEALMSRQPCEIYGVVVKHSVKQDMNGQFSFTLREERPTTVAGEPATIAGEAITVVSLKPKPANFDQADHVKAIGVADGSRFTAQDLLIKCPSKYQGVDKAKSAAERADLTNLGMAGMTVAMGLAAFAVISRSTRC